MKLFKTIITASMIIGLLAFSLAAAEKSETKEEKEEQVDKKTETTEKIETTEFKNQTHCPVMGGEIDSSAFTDLQGQRVYHCCPGCTKALNEDPDKYFQKAAADGILFENIQTNCPVSGKELTEKVSFVDYEGRRVYFCCDGCAEPFGKEPQKFLSVLNEKPEMEMKDEASEEKSDHSAHGDH